MKAKLFTTDFSEGLKLTDIGEFEFAYKPSDVVETYEKDNDVEQGLIQINPEIEYHTFGGFGGAFTETAASAWCAMSDDRRNDFMRAYFDSEHGIGYTFGRVHIGSCDFCKDYYQYVDEGDMTLDSFNVQHDKAEIIPMIKAAAAISPIKLLASPWSPPRYMKTVNSYQGGHLRRDCYRLWADYIRRYVQAYRSEGIDIWGVTIQNEPRHHQQWESCLYTPDEESEYLGYLGRALQDTGVGIFCYDHCRERMVERALAIFDGQNGRYCAGIACHWYSGDHFGQIAAVRHRWPERVQIASEGCCFDPYQGIKADGVLAYGEKYAHDICGSISSGISYYCDWNLTLNEFNGPDHCREGRNFVDAPIYCDGSRDRLVIQPSYYYIGHYSKFIRPGAKCIAASSYTELLEVCAFKNTDGTIAVVVLNRSEQGLPFTVRLGDNTLPLTAPPHTIHTLVVGK